MSQFIESIKLLDGQLYLLPYHEARINRTREAFYDLARPISLRHLFSPTLLTHPKGLFKIRVLYDQAIEKIEIHPYTPRPIQSLKIVQGQLDYTYKTTDRKAIHQLYAQREQCDDILIIKNGLVTDSSYCNIAFFDGAIWWTPATPLLKGVQRQFLLDQGIISARNIALTDITSFQKIKLFNAIIDWEMGIEILVKNIVL